MSFLSKYKSEIIIGVSAFLFFYILALPFADAAVVDSYTQISPLPGIGESVPLADEGGAVRYFNNIFRIFISVIAVLGVIKLMICGFQYMTSEAISSKEAAKKCLAGVFGGLLLVLLSVLVLQTINPALTSLDFFGTLKGSIEGNIPSAQNNGGGSSTDYCFRHLFNIGDGTQIICRSTEQECEAFRATITGGQFVSVCELRATPLPEFPI